MQPYPNPPIKEAIVEIKTEPLPTSCLDTIEKLHDRIKKEYPEKKKRTRYQGSINISEAEGISSFAKNLGPDGFLFTGKDGLQVVQYLLDGFVFSRLRPYPSEGWPSIRPEIEHLWKIYQDVIKPSQIIRIGMRYINQIDIPSAQVDLEDYFSEPPRVPQGLEQTLEHFLTRLVVSQPQIQGKSIISQILAPSSQPGFTSIILDIDVLTEKPMNADTTQIMSTLDRFRHLKNEIFKQSVKPKTEELFL